MLGESVVPSLDTLAREETLIVSDHLLVDRVQLSVGQVGTEAAAARRPRTRR